MVRDELDRKGKVRLSKKGEPVDARLPHEFDPIDNAVPYAQASLFSIEGQSNFEFRFLKDVESREGLYRIRCSEGHAAIEFRDREKPRSLPKCAAQASGQMCVDPRNGEISALAFYGLNRTEEGCVWDREAPFAIVEQALIEQKTGARFPSRVQTIFSLDDRDDAMFEQRFEECRFTRVEVQEIYRGVAGDTGRP